MCEIISKNPMFLLNDNTKKESLISPRANISGAITYQFFKGKEEIPVNMTLTPSLFNSLRAKDEPRPEILELGNKTDDTGDD